MDTFSASLLFRLGRQLEERSWVVKRMEGDGNCFFRAVRHLLFPTLPFIGTATVFPPPHVLCLVLRKARGVANDTVLDDNLSNDRIFTNGVALLGKHALVWGCRSSPRLKRQVHGLYVERPRPFPKLRG